MLVSNFISSAPDAHYSQMCYRVKQPVTAPLILVVSYSICAFDSMASTRNFVVLCQSFNRMVQIWDTAIHIYNRIMRK